VEDLARRVVEHGGRRRIFEGFAVDDEKPLRTIDLDPTDVAVNRSFDR
jgi:hypothetical protein